MIVEVAIGILLGALSTFFTLSLFHSLIKPRLYFSKNIRVVTDDGPGYNYYIRLKASGAVNLIDTRAVCRIYVKDIGREGSTFTNSYEIPCTWASSLMLRPRKIRTIRILWHQSDIVKFDRTYGVDNLELYPLLREAAFPRIQEYGRRLEDVFLSFDRVHIRLLVMGHDSVTGVKSVYSSPKYTFHNLMHGNWSDVDEQYC